MLLLLVKKPIQHRLSPPSQQRWQQAEIEAFCRMAAEAGNPEGVPVVCLHGGPGAGANAWTRRFFDHSHYRVIPFDQRGAGRSTPYARHAE